MFKAIMASSTNWTSRTLCQTAGLTCLLVLLVTEPQTVSCLSFYDSITSLKALAANNELLAEKFQGYLVKKEEGIAHIPQQFKRVAVWTERQSSMTDLEWEEYLTKMVEHPINAFNLIKDWNNIRKLTDGSDEFTVLFADIESRGINIPGNLDYNGALVALIRLQRTYNLLTADMVKGVINNVTAHHGMDPEDCFQMGKLAMGVKHGMALSWLELFLQMGVSPAEQTDALRLITDIYKQVNDYEGAWETTDKMIQLDQENPISVGDVRLYIYKRMMQKQHFWKKINHDRGMERYQPLCRGENASNDIRVDKSLLCIYRPGKIPYMRYKEEIHSFSPRISMFLDVLSDDQAEMVKSKAAPGLYRAQVVPLGNNGDSSHNITTEGRVTKINWLWDTDKDVRRISMKISDITGMSTEQHDRLTHAEAFQIANYGMAGQYEPHYDFYEDVGMLERLPAHLTGTGDRISTFMYYLSDVTAGGATVFPNIGVHLPPIKNAAAYWYNFDLAGETGDARTLHAGCPVILGQKWIGNKWIRQEGQHFRRRCALDKHTVDPIWYS